MGNTIRHSESRERTKQQWETAELDDRSWIDAIERSYTFVWCDGQIGTDVNPEDDQYTMFNIADLINRNRKILHTFNDIKACQEFVTYVSNVCLIISGSFGEKLVPLIHNLPQIHSIYIFCLNKSYHQHWSAHYSKVRGVYTNILDICRSLRSDIICQLASDLEAIKFDLLHPALVSSIQSKEAENAFLYSKSIKILLLNMDSSDHGKQDMINYCRNEYKSDYQIQLINDFERNYTQQNPIWWYTKNCFFQGIVNRALSTYDLYTLCSMHRFLKDIDAKLGQLNEIEQTKNEPLKLYYGQFLHKNDFELLKENRGGFMCINQFLSANYEQGIAIMFLKNSTHSSSNRQQIPVLFEIHIDRTVEGNAFYANIGSISQFVHEQEYLISMCSVYRIEKIEKIPDVPLIYFVQITLLPRNDMQYHNLTQSIQKEQLNADFDLTELGHKVKNRLNLFKSANKLFKQRLHRYPHERRQIILHYNLAIIYDILEDYEKSIGIYRSAINFLRNFLANPGQQDDICSVPLYANLAFTYEQQNKFVDALSNAFLALRIVLESETNIFMKKEMESACYYNLGSIHDQEKRSVDAKTFYEEALKIRREYLPIGHSDVTVLQRLITLLSPRQTDVTESSMF